MKLIVKMSSYVRNRANLCVILVLIALSACVTNKDATLLQEHEESMYSSEYVVPDNYRIRSNDNLYIQVTSPDPNITSIFNALGDGGYNRGDEASAHLSSYPVELDGTVDLPFVGIVDVAGKTLPEAKATIQNILKEYVLEFSLTVKLVNNYVSVLGEVRSPGMYLIYKERLNIYQALAMAGDVADFSDRYQLAIIRQTEKESIVKEFDITDRSIIDSEFYYVMPNDVIYVKPMKGRYFAINTAPWTFALATLTAAFSLIILVQNNILLRNQ